MPSLVDKFFNIFNRIIGINRSDDIERELSQRPTLNYKVEKVMINEFAKLSKLKNNPESIEKRIFDNSQRHFIERRLKSSDGNILSFNELIKVVEKERFGLIVGDIGAGKTRAIERICQRIQGEIERKLVFYVNLSGFLEKFQRNDLNFNEKFSLKFLLNFDSLEYEIFKEMANEDRILIFFDGFDEIAQNYKSEIINLLLSIKKNTKISFWLASRRYNSTELEFELKIKSFELLPFTFNDAKDYLNSLLAQINYDRSRFEKMLENFFTNQNDNLNQPIILSMIEEILLDKHANESLTEDVNLIHIFIKRKIEFGEFCDSSLLSLLKLAIHTIFGDKFLLCGSTGDKNNRHELFKSYLITHTADKGELQFVDRSFAAYFVAEYVIKNVWIYGSFFPQFDGDRRLLGCLLDDILDVRNYERYSLVYDNVKRIIECGKVKERINVNFSGEIDEKTIMTMNFTDLSKFCDHQTDKTVKILKFQQFTTLRDTFELFNNEKFHQFLSLNPNIFTLILKFTDSTDFNDQNVANYLQYINLSHCNPPLILSFECINDCSQLIYYFNNEKYQKVAINEITEENFLQTIKNEFNIGILMSAIKSKVIGSFYGKFEQMKLNTKDFYNQKRLIDYALEYKDEVCIKFLQIFDTFDVLKENLKSQTILEIAAEHCGEKEIKLMSENEKILMEFKDKRGRNLLMIAAKAGNIEAVKYFLKLNFDVNEKVIDLTAADLAYENNHLNILNALLHANSQFPLKFDKSILDTETSFDKEKLKQFVKISIEMENSILTGDQNQITKLCINNPNLRHFYNLSNESAMKAAMKHRKIQLYHLLSLKGLSLSPHEQQLCEDSRADFDESVRHQRVRVVDDYLSAIFGKTFVINSIDNDEASKEIMCCYIELLKIPEVKILWKILSKIQDLEIIFDFQANLSNKTQENIKKIVIAAHGINNEAVKCQILANLVHKMCQLSMRNVFDNDGNPYNKKDVDTKLKFFKITKHCYENCDKEVSMKTIFRSVNSESWHKELVALIPYIVVLYQRNEARLSFVRKSFQELFEFYEEFIMRKIE